MKGINLVKRAMNLEEVERIPWVPFVKLQKYHTRHFLAKYKYRIK